MRLHLPRLLALVLLVPSVQAIFRTNVLMPYNFVLYPDYTYPIKFDTQFIYEGGFAAHGYAPHVHGTKNPLQLFQCEQDGIAALKGFDSQSDIGQLAQFFNINDDNTTHGIWTPSANFYVPFNGMFALVGGLGHHVTLEFYTQYLVAELKDVCWKEKNTGVEFEDNNVPNLLGDLSALGHIDLTHGWQRHGFGDTVGLIRWKYDFIQFHKRILHNVRLSARGGVLVPTGLTENNSILLGLPFGYDQGWGVIFGGNMGLFTHHQFRFTLDLEFLQLFGNTKARRVATNVDQTDLFLLKRQCVFVDPGFTQQYTFMLEKRNFWNNFSASVAYQYYKHNDDTYYPVTNEGNFAIINDAQVVQEWTTHQFLFKMQYEFNAFNPNAVRPQLSIFGKYGFNGKRAIVDSSVGLSLTVAF